MCLGIGAFQANKVGGAHGYAHTTYMRPSHTYHPSATACLLSGFRAQSCLIGPSKLRHRESQPLCRGQFRTNSGPIDRNPTPTAKVELKTVLINDYLSDDTHIAGDQPSDERASYVSAFPPFVGMPPRPASQCCRVLQHQMASPRDGIWVPDSLLASAFDRYCLVSKQLRRKTGNVPGPLESRRRLGKRQIGGLNFVQSTPSLPAWALPNAVDLSKWKWEPPTPHSARSEKLRNGRLAEDALPAWLREWTPTDLEEPAPQPTRSHNATPQAPRSILDDLDSFRTLVLADPAADVYPELNELCQRLEKQLCLGQVASKALGNTLRDVLEALDARSRLGGDISGPSVTIYSAVINGITSSSVWTPANFGRIVWGSLLAHLAKLPVNDDLCKLFELVMDTVHPHHHRALSKEVLSVFNSFYSAWSGTDGCDHPSVASYLQAATEAEERCQCIIGAAGYIASDLEIAKSLLRQGNEACQTCDNALNSAANAISSRQRQVQAVSKAFSRLKQNRQLIAAANQLVLSQSPRSPETYHQLRYNWLSALAQSPRVSQDVLLEAHKTVFGEPTAHLALTGTEICQLLIDHWVSLGRLTHPEKFGLVFESLRIGQDSASIAALAYTVFREEKGRSWLIEGMCGFLKAVGRLEELPGSFDYLEEAERLPVRLLERVATASDDHLVAMELHGAYVDRFERPDEADWDPRTWWKYLDAIFMDPAVSPSRLWKLLGIEFYEDMVKPEEPWQRKQRCSHGTESAAIVANLAVRFAYADHLENRVAYRHVSQCVLFLERYIGKVPPTVLQALYHVVSRDLAEGLPGRTTRLQWFLDVIERQCGEQISGECALLLQHWRHLVLRMNQIAALS